MEDNYEEGVFLGMRLRSDEIILRTKKGVIKARSVRRRPEAKGWDRDLGRAIRWTPRTPVPGRPGDYISTHTGGVAGEADDQEQGPPQVQDGPQEEGNVPLPSPVDRELNEPRPMPHRRMYVTGAMVEQHGKTDGCQGCRAIGTGRVATH